MAKSRRNETSALLVVAALAIGAPAFARKPPRPSAPFALTPEQQVVVAEVVNDTFRLSRKQPRTFELCLDVQVAAFADEEAAPPPARARARGSRSRSSHAHPASPELPPPPIIRGATRDVIDLVTRPWRHVVSATACRLDPRAPYALNDAQRTPAQLVTVHLQAPGAAGALKIEWTGATAEGPPAHSSRDCVAAAGPHGWTVTCGGTWFE